MIHIILAKKNFWCRFTRQADRCISSPSPASGCSFTCVIATFSVITRHADLFSFWLWALLWWEGREWIPGKWCRDGEHKQINFLRAKFCPWLPFCTLLYTSQVDGYCNSQPPLLCAEKMETIAPNLKDLGTCRPFHKFRENQGPSFFTVVFPPHLQRNQRQGYQHHQVTASSAGAKTLEDHQASAKVKGWRIIGNSSSLLWVLKAELWAKWPK